MSDKTSEASAPSGLDPATSDARGLDDIRRLAEKWWVEGNRGDGVAEYEDALRDCARELRDAIARDDSAAALREVVAAWDGAMEKKTGKEWMARWDAAMAKAREVVAR